MKRYRRWGRRILGAVLAVVMTASPETAVLAKEAADAVSEAYQEYEQERQYEEERDAVAEQVIPEQEEEGADRKDQEQGEISEVEDASREEAWESAEEGVSLRLPDTKEYIDETEAELEGLYGEPVEVSGHEKIYQVDERNYVTYLTSEANTYVAEDGEERETDLTLIPTDEITGEQCNAPTEEQIKDPDLAINYVTKDSETRIVLPANATKEKGIQVQNGEYVLELCPEDGDYGNATIQERALLYNQAREKTDIQYTAQSAGLKEDIILQEWTGLHTFRYSFPKSGGGDIEYAAESLENQILIREKGEEDVLFVLSAPVMTDAAGEESQGLSLSIEENQDTFYVTLDAEEGWLADPSRVYPVKIDPTVTVPTSSLIEVTTSTVRGTYQGEGYGYAGYITGRMTGVPGAADIGRSRMYYAINYNFRKNIPDEAKINSATLNVYQYVQYPQTNATFACYRLKAGWNPGSLTWDASVGIPMEPAGVNCLSGAKHGMHQFDIRESVNNWVQGISPNYGLVVMATRETDYGGAFYTPYSTGTEGQTDFTWDKRPSITIHWSVPDPVDMDYNLNDTSAALRSMMLTDRSGKLQFQGVFADGVATPGATALYALNDPSKNYNGAVYASYSYKYPDSTAFQSAFPEGTTKYKDKLGNWQTVYPFTELEFNVKYYLNVAAVKDGVTGRTNKSEDFTVYKVTQFDTLPKIANYYGIPLAQLMHDNRVQDMLLVENNTLFIRNPKKNAETPYNPPALTDEDKAAVDASLMGRGLHCEFGFEPVNLNTGNFYLDRTDVSIPDYTEDFEIRRSYNSMGAALNGVFGRGWAFSYSEQLSQAENGDLNYQRADGSILKFTKEGDAYQSPEGYDLTLERTKIKENKYDFGDGEETYPVYEYTITDAEQNVKTFDCFGSLTGIKDEKGNQTQLIYDANKNLKQIKSASGRSYGITADTEGHITEIALPNGSSLRYGYDENGNLVSFTDACGAQIRYEYDGKHRMTAWYDGNGNCVVTNEYDEMGRVIRQTDACGGVSLLEYGEGKTIATDAGGNVTTYYYDGDYRTVRVENPDKTARSMSYGGDNRLASETDEAGHTTGYAYDERGNCIKETRFDGASVTRVYDEGNHLVRETGYDGVTTAYTYDGKGSLASVSRDGALVVSYDTDSQGRILGETNANGNTTQYTYDGADLTGITDPEGGHTSISYNAQGQILSVTNPMGGVARYSYDGEGRKVKETTPDGVSTSYSYDPAGSVTAITDGNGYTVSFAYDAMGRRVGTDNGSGGQYNYVRDALGNEVSMTDAEGNTTVYAYDWRGNVLRERDSGGNQISYAYDALGNQTGEIAPSGAAMETAYDYAWNQVKSVTDAAGHRVTYTFQESGLPAKIDYPGGTNETYRYDRLGRVTEYTDEAGLVTVYTYDAAGNVLSGDAEGQVTRYSYNKNNQVTEVIRPDGAKLCYAYDKAGNLTEFTDAEGQVTSYHYTRGGSLASVTDPLGRKTILGYDKNGNLTELTDAAGNTSSISYGAQNQKISETDALGYVTSYAYNQVEQIISLTDAAGYATSYAYNDQNRLSSVTDANGNTWNFEYDSDGNYSRITAPDGTETTYAYNELDQVIKEEDSVGLAVEYEYDEKGRLIHTWDNEGMDTSYTYNGAGSLLTETNALGECTEYTYDKYQRLTHIREASGAETEYEYDAAGNVTAMTAPDGSVTSYSYDKNGNLLSQEKEGRIWNYEYDAAGQLIRETDPEGGETIASYDLLGNLASVTDAEGHTKKYGYNALSQLVYMEDAKGGETLLAYDALGRLIKTTDPEGGGEAYAYDKTGNLISYTDGEGNTRTAVYDSLNRLAKEILPKGGETSYTYDNGGALKSETDALGNVTSYENNRHGQPVKRLLPNGAEYTYAYDRLGRITGQTAPQGLSRTYAYDSAGNLVKETDQSGRETLYEYDIMGQLTGATDALGQKTSYQYDEVGNLIQAISPMGHKTRYSYDRLDRLTEETDPSGRTEAYVYDKIGNLIQSTVNGEHETRYSYDANGNLTEATNALGVTEAYGYDRLNRLTGITDGNGDRTAYAYNHNSQLTAITDPLGGVTALTYDGDGNLAGLTDPEGRGAVYAYDLADRLVSVQTGAEGEGTSASYTYDSAGNVTASADGNGNQTTYGYDLLGNLTAKTNPLGQTETYAYNQDNQLSQITRADGTYVRYDYNKLDALLKTDYSEQADGQVLYAYDPEGKRVSMEDLTGTSLYEYDKNGRVTGVQQGDGSVIRYGYDSFGNLTSLTYPDGSAVTYTYDAIDRLIGVTDREGKETSYTYDDAGNLTEVDRANQTSAIITYDGAGQVSEIRNLDKEGELQSSYRYHYDLSGSIQTEEITTTDPEGKKSTLLNTYAYDSAGQLTQAEKKDTDGNLLETIIYGYDAAGNHIQTITNRHTIHQAITGEGADGAAPSRSRQGMALAQPATASPSGESIAVAEQDAALADQEQTDTQDATDTLTVTGTTEYNAANQPTATTDSDGSTTTYLYDQNGNRIRSIRNGEEIKEYTYDTENRLIAVRDNKGLLMAALYDGDSNRMFTASRTEDTHAYQLYKASPKTSTQGKEGSIFWYGFGQNFIQAFHVAKEELGRVWKDTWEDLVSAYHRKIAKDRANDEGLVVNPDGLTNMPGDGPTTYPSDTAQALIPYKVIEETYDYYEVRNYVNDVNQAYTQVLTSYDHNGKSRESYTYGLRDNGEENSLDGTYLPGSDTAGNRAVSGTGLTQADNTGSRILSRLGASPANSATSGLSAALGGRLDYGNGKQTWYYGYTGTGSVSQLTDRAGILATAYSYDPFGNTTVQDYTGNLTGNRNIIENYTLNPYTYNAEYTDASTGNQYLRARYYSPETGNFFTEDSYLGSLLEPLERNLYSYAENDPVNYSDPSGHGILSKIWNKVKSTAKNLYNKAKAGLNNYMNSSTYKSYFNNPSSTSSKGRTGASTGNGYVGRNTGGSKGVGGSYNYYSGSSGGGGGSGNTSYRYVKYNPTPPYHDYVGGRVRYFQTEAEMETARKVCDTAEQADKQELAVSKKQEDILKVAATGIVLAGAGAVAFATGGTALLIPGVVGTVVGGLSGAIGSAASGGDILDGILSGMVNGALSGILPGTILGNLGGNFVGGVIGNLYGAFLNGDTSKETLKNSIIGSIPQMIIGGAWGNVVGKEIPIANGIDAAGSGVAAWPAELVGISINTGYNAVKRK